MTHPSLQQLVDGLSKLAEEPIYHDLFDRQLIRLAAHRLKNDASHTGDAQLANELPGLTKWFANGERGLSSNAMALRLTGIETGLRAADRIAHPLDADDLRRCRLLLERVPSLATRLHWMADVSPQWKSIIDHWGHLCFTMDVEAPDWRPTPSPCPRTNDLLYKVGRVNVR